MIAQTYVDPTLAPGWRGPILMPVEIILGDLAGMPKTIQGLLDSVLRTDHPDRVVGVVPEDLRDSIKTLMAVATDFGQLAQQHLDAITPDERAETWRQVKTAREAEELARTKENR